MAQVRLLHRHNSRFTSSIAGITTVASTFYYYYSRNHAAVQSEASTSHPKRSKTNFKTIQKPAHVGVIETDFVDKLSTKPYLTYHNTNSRDSLLSNTIHVTKKLWSKAVRNDVNPVVADENRVVVGDADDADGFSSSGQGGMGRAGKNVSLDRPKGIPRRLRILAIDVPEFREVFDGECRMTLSKVYPDDIAPPKRIKRKINKADQHFDDKKDTDKISENEDEIKDTKNSEKEIKIGKQNREEEEKLEIIQKSLARSLVRCRNRHSKRIGVELLEASIYDLNPLNMRRTYQFGIYRYDPGKYGSMKKVPGEEMLERRKTVGSRNRTSTSNPHFVSGDSSDDTELVLEEEEELTESGVADFEDYYDDEGNAKKEETTVLATEDDEMDAPWNQYAWIEEMQLRIHGYIPFGANLERSSFFSRYIFGNSYRRSVPPARGYLQRVLPSILVGTTFGGDDGIDGDYGDKKRTINRASSKPHAVIADGSALQRVPGSLRYLTKCCQEADVPLFIINDPRVWGGNTHTDLESAANDMKKSIKAKMVANALTIKEGSMFERGRLVGKVETEAKWQVKDAERRTRQAVQDARDRFQKVRDDDWSKISGNELLDRLVKRKVLTVYKNSENKIDIEYTEAFAELCKAYVENEKKRLTLKNSSNNIENDMDSSADEFMAETQGGPISGGSVNAVPT